MIRRGTYKDRPAILVESGDFLLTLLPEDGAKIASLVDKPTDKERMAVKPGDTYARLTETGSYVAAECSAFDDMFPTVDPCTVGDFPAYPDHGEACRLPYAVTIAEEQVVLEATSRLFPVTYRKTVQPTADGGVDVTYTYENHGDTPFPFLWAGHIMLQGEDDLRVLTPFSAATPTERMFADGRLPTGDLPKDRLMAHRPGAGATYKFYYLSPMSRGEFGVAYADGSRLLFTVDPQKIPYLGLWLNNGYFQGLYTVTPEPCTVPFDAPSRAAERGYSSVIPPGADFTFTLHISRKENT